MRGETLLTGRLAITGKGLKLELVWPDTVIQFEKLTKEQLQQLRAGELNPRQLPKL